MSDKNSKDNTQELEPWALSLLKYGYCDWVQVESSNLDKIKYDANKQELYVTFKSGGVYKYFRVPQDEFEKLLVDAKSKGSYFHKHIRTSYKYQKL